MYIIKQNELLFKLLVLNIRILVVSIGDVMEKELITFMDKIIIFGGVFLILLFLKNRIDTISREIKEGKWPEGSVMNPRQIP